MRWSDERYVRVYTRDTIDWQSLSFIAQGLFVLLLRKVDRAGILPLGRHGKRGVATAIGFPGEWSRLEPALEELLTDKCVTIEGNCLVVPNFIEAQEAPASDAQRKRDQRERDRDLASHGIPKRDQKSQNGTNSHAVTLDGHTESRTVPVESQAVTPNCAVPSVPSLAVPTQGNGVCDVSATSQAILNPAAERWPFGERLRLSLSRRFAPMANGGRGLNPPSTAGERDQLEIDLATVGYDAGEVEAIDYGERKGAGNSTRSLSFWTGRLHTFAQEPTRTAFAPPDAKKVLRLS